MIVNWSYTIQYIILVKLRKNRISDSLEVYTVLYNKLIALNKKENPFYKELTI